MKGFIQFPRLHDIPYSIICPSVVASGIKALKTSNELRSNLLRKLGRRLRYGANSNKEQSGQQERDVSADKTEWP